jgi:hypothetical protein
MRLGGPVPLIRAPWVVLARQGESTSGVFLPLDVEELSQLEIAAGREGMSVEDFIIDCLMRLRVFNGRATG